MSDSNSKVCRVCGSTDFTTYNRCRPCSQARSARYRAANADVLKAKKLEYHKANSEQIRAKVAAWSVANHERKKETAAEYRKKNRDAHRAYKAVWAEKNSNHVVEKVRAWRKANPGAHQLNNENRRAKKKAGGGISKGLTAELLAKQDGKCACCGEPLNGKYHLDHIMPLALGGAHSDDNMQLLLPRCNMQKHDMHPDEFMKLRASQRMS